MLRHGGPCCDMRSSASLGGGLYWFVFSPFCLERCYSSLFIFKFPFVENKVSHVFNDVLVYFLQFMSVLMLVFGISREIYVTCC